MPRMNVPILAGRGGQQILPLATAVGDEHNGRMPRYLWLEVREKPSSTSIRRIRWKHIDLWSRSGPRVNDLGKVRLYRPRAYQIEPGDL